MKNLKIVTTIVLAGMMVLAVGDTQKVDAASMDPKAALTPEMALALSKNVNRHVLVIMKNIKFSGADAANDQASVMNELHQVNAARIKPYRMVNSFAATVADGEVERLKANPAVAMVVSDTVIRHAKSPQSLRAAMTAKGGAGTSLVPNVIPKTCHKDGKVLLDPEALQTTNTNSDNKNALTARSLGLTGAGVKVAWIADGIDPQNVNFIRADGTSAFVDYQDFSNDGPGAVTAGGEAFLDANAIAGQGLHTYDISNFSAQPEASPCNIRIEGVAPGAQLVGLKIFSQTTDTTESSILEAIEYAVTTAHVDVLNESFGNNSYPDTSAQDITKLFNDAAVKAGVTVTVSSGDAGNTNTIGSPSTDPLVISVGASTAFRFYAQTNYASARYFATTGWLNDNISSLSSSGFSQTGGTVDIVAPGDLGFASCDASATFQDCLNFQGQPSALEESGGTSQSSPLTAGAAALVIEAYRNAHNGSSPAPAVVKQIITSTATDLGAPATEQGAGLLNTYKAALLAQTINNGKGGSISSTSPVLFSVNQLNSVAAAGTYNTWPVVVTNTSAVPQILHAKGRTFGPVRNVQSGQVTLNDASSPQYNAYNGIQNNYSTFTFNVPGDTDRLNASIAYPGNPGNGNNSRVRLILIDPKGRLAAHSLPQGVGNFGNASVRQPVKGKWTGVIFSDVASAGGTNGTVPWQISTQNFVAFGSVSPSVFFLLPGQSQTLNVAATTPLTAGDSAGSIVVTSSTGGVDKYVGAESNSIAVTLRSLINVPNGGAFNGVLTGGNGRPNGEGQVQFYQFQVNPGHTSIQANVSITNDVGDSVGAYLVGPDGVARGFGQNSLNGANTLALSAYTLNPTPGTWTLIVDFAEPVVGDEISQPYSGNVKFDNVSASAPATLPNDANIQLLAGSSLTVPVTITNTGVAPEAFFVDARLNTTTSVQLAAQGLPASGFVGYVLPVSGSVFPLWLVPSETSSIQVAASANLPIEFDYGPGSGDPDLFGAPASTDSNTALGSYAPTGGNVMPGNWSALPAELGPFPAGGAPAGIANMSFTVTTKEFDSTISSTTGDLWLNSLNASYAGFSPVTINPGQSAVVNVTITPSGPSGTVVSGNLYIDDFVSGVAPNGETTGDELVAIPYTYSIH